MTVGAPQTKLSTWSLICADIARGWDRPVPSRPVARVLMVAGALGSVRGFATVGFRVSHALGRRRPVLGAIAKQLNQVVTGCDIAHEATIGPGLRLLHPGAVVITPAAVIGERFTIHSAVTVGGSPEGAPLIGDDVNLAPGCRVLGAVTIGNRVRVGANAVVTKSFPESDIVLAGVPARLLRSMRVDEVSAPNALDTDSL